MDCIIHGVAKSWTGLSNFHFHFHFTQSYVMGFPHSSVGKESACKAEDPGSIPGSGRYPWRSNRLPTPGFLGFPCGSAGRRTRLPTPVFWPEEFHGLYGPWSCKELDMTEQLSLLVVKNLPANSGDVISRKQVWSLGGKIPWRRAWQLTPVFSPGESHGHRSLVGYLMDIGLQSVGHARLKQLSMHAHRHIQALIFFLFIAFSSLQSQTHANI